MVSAVAGPTPKAVHVRAHQCGFGDTLLISFEYAEKLDDGRRERHILCDFGSTRWPKKSPPSHLAIAESIAERVTKEKGGRLDVIVLTHRHKDHISGFGDPRAGEIIASLEPRLVVRPWTEDPDLPATAKGPKALGDNSKAFLANMSAAEDFAAEVHQSLKGAAGNTWRGALAAMAAHQIPNQAAIDRLNELAEKADLGATYLYAGKKSGIEEAVPGIDVAVLGPPTPDMWPRVTGERADDPEYWLTQQGRLRTMLAGAVEPEPEPVTVPGEKVPPGPVRWLVEKMRGEQTTSLLRIVETLDDAMNNTSLILYFSVGARRLLFPGDAQIENWSYCLQPGKAAALGADLADVDLYKVGHHGSRNATPRQLVEGWRKSRRNLTSVMSTMPGVHGKREATAVPRATLIAALEELGTLARTDELAAGELYFDLSASTSRRTKYRRVDGP
jgi:hypothetical protein